MDRNHKASDILGYMHRRVADERREAETRLRKAIVARQARFPFDTNGHGRPPEARELSYVEVRASDPERNTNIDVVNEVTDAIERGITLPASAGELRLFFRSGASSCPFCDDLERKPGREILYALEESRIVADHPCPAPAGPCIVRLSIPSGELAVGSDLRAHFPTEPAGCWRTSITEHKRGLEQYAEQGVALIVTGEGGDLTRETDGTLLLGKTAYADETTCFELPGAQIPELVASPDFGVRSWWCFADGARIPQGTNGVARIPVEPGTYAFTIHCIDRDWVHDPETVTGPRIMATIRREPTP